MNKKITPLGAWKIIKQDALYYVQSVHMVGGNRQEEIQKEKKRISVIERTLKEKEKLSKQRYVIFTRTHQQKEMFINEICKSYKEIKVGSLEDNKKLEAIEIIKGEFEIDFNDNEQTITLKSLENPYLEYHLTRKIEDKKRYQLLKEVLL